MKEMCDILIEMTKTLKKSLYTHPLITPMDLL